MPSEAKRPGPFDPIKINIVEEEDWKKKYDSATGALDWVSDQGWEDFRHMDLTTLEGLIEDIIAVPKKGKKKSKINFTPEQLEYLARELKDRSDKLEQTQRMITDAATWMYEAAAIPSDKDVEYAMERAKEDFTENQGNDLYGDPWDPIIDENVRNGPKDWSPIKRYSSVEILSQLFQFINFKREKDHWDRYLVFDFWNAPYMQTLFSRWKGSAWAYDRISSEFKSLAEGYVNDVLKRLGKIMEDVDISNRADWSDSWKSMLKNGEAWGAQEELAELAKEMPEDFEGRYA